MKNILLISSDAGQAILYFSAIILIFIAMFIKDEIEKYDDRIKRENDQIKRKKEQDKERELLTYIGIGLESELNKVKKDYIGKEFIFSKRFVDIFLDKHYENYLNILKLNNYKLKCIDLKLIENISFGGLNCNTIVKFGIDEDVLLEFKLLHIIHADNDLFNTEEYIKISNKFGEDNIIRSLNGHFLINSTKEEVEIAIGKPDKIIKKIKNEYYEKYVYKYKVLNKNKNEYSILNKNKNEYSIGYNPYRETKSFGVNLFFKNGILKSIEEY